MDYAKKVESLLRSDLVRTELDDSNNTMGKKIRTNTTRKIPILLILGDQEEADATVTIRRYGIEQQDTMPLDTFHTLVREEIRARKHVKG